MRSYWAVISARFRMLLQYRAAAAAGFGTQLFWGLIRVMIFAAFYAAGTASHPMTYGEVVNYIWLSQAMFALLPMNADTELRDLVRSGNVVYELLRPIDLYSYWYCRALAFRSAPTVLRAVPMFVFATLFFGLQPPASAACGIAWAASTAAALLLASAVTSLLAISLLWTISGEGASRLLSISVYVLGGLIVPLPLLPHWLQGVVNFLPFRGIVDVPARLYMGHIPPAQALPMLLHQLAWTAALVAFGRALLSRGLRRLVVQG
ncbi:MAG: ABC transporter permease, partial [Planctomycetota bacterium]